MVGSTYPSAWALRYTPGDLKSLARAYTSMGNNLGMQGQYDLRKISFGTRNATASSCT